MCWRSFILLKIITKEYQAADFSFQRIKSKFRTGVDFLQVLSPRALVAHVLSPEALFAEVLTPRFIEPRIISPELLIIYVLSPGILLMQWVQRQISIAFRDSNFSESTLLWGIIFKKCFINWICDASIFMTLAKKSRYRLKRSRA